jgi:tRNA (mo5U34)-methyltransferase
MIPESELKSLATELQEALAKKNADTEASAVLLNNLAIIEGLRGNFTDADVSHKRCSSILEKVGPSSAKFLAQSLANRAALYRAFGHYHEGERVFQLAIRLWNRHGWPASNEMERNLEEVRGDCTQHMLWAEVIEPNGLLRYYSRAVEALKGSPEKLQQTIVKLSPWYHDIQLTSDVSTYPPHKEYVANRWKVLSEFMPKDLSGKTVLDIGCNAGFFSLKMKTLNAGRVVGIDIMPHCLAQARFISHWFREPIELRELGAYDVESLGRFDLILFIGVLYHLRHPLYAIDKVASICNDTTFLQSAVRGDSGDFIPAPDYAQNEREIFKRPEFPRMYFIEKSLNGDESNWWIPNTSCLIAMARSAGFREVLRTSHAEVIVCKK